jgi:hypothetical protein
MITADQWNAAHPVGTPVLAWPGFLDDEPLSTRTRTPAWTLGHGDVVVSVDGYAGGIVLDHIEVRDADDTTAETPVPDHTHPPFETCDTCDTCQGVVPGAPPTPDLDLDAIRADLSAARGIDWADRVEAQLRILDVHLPALLARVDELDAAAERLRDVARRADARADDCARKAAEQGRARIAEQRQTEQVVAERDRARTALQATLDSARIDRAAAASTDRLALLRAAIEKLRTVRVDGAALTGADWYGAGFTDAIRELEEIADRWPDPEPEAHPPVDEYRVQVHDPVDNDLPSGGWTAFSSGQETADDAVAMMLRRRERRPDIGPLRVIRIRKTYTVVATESADVATGIAPPPLAPQGTPAPQGPQTAA